jgi:hypothetical protein
MPNVKVTLNRWFLRTRQRSKVGRSYPIDAQSATIEAESGAAAAIAAGDSGDSGSINNPAPDIDNEHPEQMHLRFPRHIGRLERWWTRTKHFWKPELTPIEKEQAEQVRHNRLIFRTMVAQMAIANKRFPVAYANLGMEYIRARVKDKYENSKPKRVHFCKWLFSADGNTIYGKVDQVPYGINPIKLVDEGVLTALTVSLGHPVGGRLDPNGGGVVISVALAGTMDIDDMFAFNKALELIAPSAPPLTFMVGAVSNGGRRTYNLKEMPHLLIAGSTGSGKSIAMLGIIGTFAARNTPEAVKILLADFKGVDFNQFENLPHLVRSIPEIPSGIVDKNSQIIPMLKWLEKENHDRQTAFSKAKVHNLDDWNRHHHADKLPLIVVVVDEIANLNRDKKTKDEFTEMVYSIASTSRATGIHLVLSTQFPKDEYISTAIKMNIPGRMAFSVPDVHGSICMIENGDAVNIFPPPGRGIFVHGVTRFMFQAPYISDGQIKEIVRNSIEGKKTAGMAKGTELAPEEIVQWSLTENNGFLKAQDVFREFTSRMEWHALVTLLGEMDGKVYPYGDAYYKVIPGGSHHPRQLEKETTGEIPPQESTDNAPGDLPAPPSEQILAITCPHCGAERHENPCEFCGVM